MKFKKSASTVPEVDMTPMIDIVFQLIAFFMVISNFEQTQADERVKLPQDQLAQPPQVKRDKEFVINFGYERNDKGEIIGAGTPLVFYAGESMPVQQFRSPLKLERDNYAATGVDPKDVSVTIRADSQVPFGQVQELIKLCQEVGFTSFALKAQQKTL